MKLLIPTHPREHLVHAGEFALTLEEAVALVLGTGSRGLPVAGLSVRVAEKLRLGKTSIQDLTELPGLGIAKAAALTGALALSRLLKESPFTSELLSPSAIYEHCHDIIHAEKEHLVVFFLDVRTRMLSRETVSIGTATESLIHPREVYRAAIQSSAQAIILAHNHPSGDPSASKADLDVTRLIAKAGSVIGIELLDHVICARTGWYSLKEHNPTLFQ